MRQMKQTIKRPFFVATALIAVFLLIRILSAQLLHFDLPRPVQDFLTLTTSVIIESLPFIVLGVMLSVAVRLWLPPGWLISHLPKHPALRRVILSLLGVFIPVCECGNVPLTRGLLAKGMTPAESLTFLLAAPILNPITIITTWQAFGSDMAIVWLRIAGGFLIANSIGWLYSRMSAEQILRTDFIANCTASSTHQHNTVKAAITLFSREAGALLPALFAGAVVAGLIQVVVPREILIAFGSNPVLSIIAMIALAFVVSICSSVDAFFALAFRGTFTAGSITSFLIFGPMIDIKLISLMRTTFQTKILLQLTGLVALLAISGGLVVNYAL